MIEFEGTRHAAFRDRLLEVIEALEEMMPEMTVTVELWKPDVVDHSGYADEQTEVWVRLDENVPGFQFQTSDRWFDSALGIIRQNNDWLIVPDNFGTETDVHAIINGTVYLICEYTEMGGIAKCKLDADKSRFVRPARTDPTYRQLGMKALIV